MAAKSLESVVSTYGKSAADGLSNPAITGAPEDQLRAPLVTLVRDGLADYRAAFPAELERLAAA